MLLSTVATLVTGSTLAGAGDPFATVTPQVVLDSVMERFPGYLIWAIRTTGADDKREHEVTAFDARSTGLHNRLVGESMLYTRATYKIVVSETGHVISEERHAITEDSVPRAALQAYLEWRRDRPAGMAVLWGAYQEPNKERLYMASIIVNAIESHTLIVNRNGTIFLESQNDSKDAG